MDSLPECSQRLLPFFILGPFLPDPRSNCKILHVSLWTLKIRSHYIRLWQQNWKGVAVILGELLPALIEAPGRSRPTRCPKYILTSFLCQCKIFLFSIHNRPNTSTWCSWFCRLKLGSVSIGGTLSTSRRGKTLRMHFNLRQQCRINISRAIHLLSSDAEHCKKIDMWGKPNHCDLAMSIFWVLIEKNWQKPSNLILPVFSTACIQLSWQCVQNVGMSNCIAPPALVTCPAKRCEVSTLLLYWRIVPSWVVPPTNFSQNL